MRIPIILLVALSYSLEAVSQPPKPETVSDDDAAELIDDFLDKKGIEKKRVNLVAFWSPRCGPCKVQLQVLADIVDEYADVHGCFGVVAINVLWGGKYFPVDEAFLKPYQVDRSKDTARSKVVDNRVTIRKIFSDSPFDKLDPKDPNELPLFHRIGGQATPDDFILDKEGKLFEHGHESNDYQPGIFERLRSILETACPEHKPK